MAASLNLGQCFSEAHKNMKVAERAHKKNVVAKAYKNNKNNNKNNNSVKKAHDKNVVENGAGVVNIGLAARAAGQIVCSWFCKLFGLCFCSNPVVVAAVGFAGIMIIGLAVTR
jgi:hypothetical protein